MAETRCSGRSVAPVANAAITPGDHDPDGEDDDLDGGEPPDGGVHAGGRDPDGDHGPEPSGVARASTR